MESISEGKHLLSDIEQSIKNALALFNSKDISGEIKELYTIDDPIVTLHDPQIYESKNNTDISNQPHVEATKILSPTLFYGENKIKDITDLSFKTTNMSCESIYSPFQESPIKSTIEEMQRVLNAKGDGFSPINPPSPEEILNLYSHDLGINISNNPSPRGGSNKNEQENEGRKIRNNKKERKTNKKIKHQNLKSNENKKTEINKVKVKSETTKENKLRDLMNIYGCTNKIKKPHSDSTIGSKSGVSRNDSVKKINFINTSSKASSTVLSRKSKRKKQKHINNLQIDFEDEELAALEKKSKISLKKKNRQRNNSAKVVKKSNLKRKIGLNSSNDITESKLNKNHQTTSREHYNSHRISNSNYLLKDNYKLKKQLKLRNSTEMHNEYNLKRTRGVAIKEHDISKMNNNKIVLNPINFPYIKHQYGEKNISKPNKNEIQSQKNSPLMDRKFQVEKEKPISILSKRLSDEDKPNRHMVVTENGVHNLNDCMIENMEINNTRQNYDAMNEDYFGQQSQLHYALPTQSSRSKEVERFLNGHYQHLPFVIGQSTNKSHNLWVNIQEALSLIKQKVPQTTEVQNIVNDNEYERPLSVLSKLTTKSIKKTHQCPAVINESLYDIPEGNVEMEEAGLKSWEDHPECIQANIDPKSVRPRCSCMPQSSLSYKKVLRQIFGGGTGDQNEASMDIKGSKEDFLLCQGGESYNAELKKVLISFTQEFVELNNKYEEMLLDPNTTKEELRQLEVLLENKEEEIKEIIARFNEAKEIGERARLEGSKSRAVLNNLEPYKSTTSIRLAQTLRRVQQFKESLKSRPSMPYLSKDCYAKSCY